MREEVFDAAPVGLGSFDAELRWAAANDALAALTGHRVEELLGRRPSAVLGPVGERTEEALRRVQESGRAEQLTGTGALPGEPDVERSWATVLFPLPEPGCVGVVAVEVTDRVAGERQLAAVARRDALLARAGHLLSTALSVEETARAVVRLVVPEVAPWCAVELVREGRRERIAAAPGDEPPGAADAGLTLPLVARGRELGTLVAGPVEGAPFGADTAAVARAVADRAALALDNALLYAQRERVAVTLQEELLPPRLPSIPWLDVAARYSAAGEGNEVGGDFYDLFASGDGWQVVIGDVVGKGPAAAAVTGLARHTMRAVAAYEGAPSQLLRVLNDALLAERGGRRLASVACVRLDPEGDGLALTVSVAGHPLPYVVRTDGTVRAVGRFGQLLGVEEDLVVFNAHERLGPGDLLVLYTDGVVDASGPDGAFTEEHLPALLAELAGLAPSRALQRVEAAVLAASGGRPRDDVAMIALTVRRS